MTQKDLCASTTAALTALIERGQAPGEELAAHWRACPRCQALIEAASRSLVSLSSALESAAEGTTEANVGQASARAIEAGEARQRQRARRNALLIVAGWAVFSMLAGASLDRPWFGDGSRLAAAAGFGMVLGLTAAIAGVAVTLLRLPGRYGFYKRQRSGYWISGVCEGLQDKVGVPTMVLRLAFVLLEVFTRSGVPLYLVLALSMPVHPEDRRHLLAFRVARWWRKVRGWAEPA